MCRRRDSRRLRAAWARVRWASAHHRSPCFALVRMRMDDAIAPYRGTPSRRGYHAVHQLSRSPAYKASERDLGQGARGLAVSSSRMMTACKARCQSRCVEMCARGSSRCLRAIARRPGVQGQACCSAAPCALRRGLSLVHLHGPRARSGTVAWRHGQGVLRRRLQWVALGHGVWHAAALDALGSVHGTRSPTVAPAPKYPARRT